MTAATVKVALMQHNGKECVVEILSETETRCVLRIIKTGEAFVLLKHGTQQPGPAPRGAHR